jgi:hypothetical protein
MKTGNASMRPETVFSPSGVFIGDGIFLGDGGHLLQVGRISPSFSFT